MALFEEYRPRIPEGERCPGPGNLIVRAATIADASAVAELQAARDGGTAAEHVAHLTTWMEAHIPTETGHLLVAVIGDRLAGYAKVQRFVAASDAPSTVAPNGWYLTGVVIALERRRQGIGRRLTRERLDWIGARDRVAYYFANARNTASIDLHRAFGFTELTRDFAYPGAHFEGGVGILFRADLHPS